MWQIYCVIINEACGSGEVMPSPEGGKTMKMKSQMGVSVCFEPFSIAVTSVDGNQTASVERIPTLSKSSVRQSMEAMTDLQSYSMMEERYGIREEGIF
jgi:hypothetical protein